MNCDDIFMELCVKVLYKQLWQKPLPIRAPLNWHAAAYGPNNDFISVQFVSETVHTFMHAQQLQLGLRTMITLNKRVPWHLLLLPQVFIATVLLSVLSSYLPLAFLLFVCFFSFIFGYVCLYLLFRLLMNLSVISKRKKMYKKKKNTKCLKILYRHRF